MNQIIQLMLQEYKKKAKLVFLALLPRDRNPKPSTRIPDIGNRVEALRSPIKPSIFSPEIGPGVRDIVDQRAIEEPISVTGGAHPPSYSPPKPRFLLKDSDTNAAQGKLPRLLLL